MKILFTSLFILITISLSAQTIFWTENFTSNSCGQATLANGYSTANGTWTVVSTGLNDAEANNFYISATENGNGSGNCGTGCGINHTLHIAANDGFSTTDAGASYNSGGLCGIFYCVTANWRAQSPTINCTGVVSVTLTFNYMEFADLAIDNASLWYFDGSTWSQLDDLTKTPCCGGPCNGTRQGQWTYFSISLPPSANNNPNVKIGFNWTNNDDAVGTDPSFAVDDIQLSSLETSVANFFPASLSIYPNPAKDELTLSAGNYKPGLNYIITDVTGRKLTGSEVSSAVQQINISDLNVGYYFIHMLDAGNKMQAAATFIKL
jgi:hypothetical protein